MDYIPILLFYECNLNISLYNKRYYQFFYSNFIIWLEKSSFIDKKKFILSTKIKDYIDHPSINKILGDSLLYIDSQITLVSFENWLLYHSKLYHSWSGSIYDHYYYGKWIPLHGELGIIVKNMINSNFPMPIDTLVAYLYKSDKWDDYSVIIDMTLDYGNPSRYKPVYSGELIGLKILLSRYNNNDIIFHFNKLPLPSTCSPELIAEINLINSKLSSKYD